MKSIRIFKLIALGIMFLFAVPMICITGCASICGQADIMFVFDTTGSMGGSIDSMKSYAVSFANALAASGIDYKLGLTEVRDFPNICGGSCGSPEDSAYKLYNDGNLADSATFSSWISSLSAGGGGDAPEAYLAALHHAALYTHWRGGNVQKIIVMVSDSTPHADGDCCNLEGDTLAGTKSILTTNGVTIFIAGNNAGGGGVPSGWAADLATTTGGKYYPLTDLTPILNDIKDKLKCKKVILLVHGIMLPVFAQTGDPYSSLKAMAESLVGPNYIFSMDPVYSMERLESNDHSVVVYVSHYAKVYSFLIPSILDIKSYAGNLAKEITKIKRNEKVNKVDIVAHSMGGLVSRWYVEKFDGGSDSINKLIMLDTPNQGTELGDVVPVVIGGFNPGLAIFTETAFHVFYLLKLNIPESSLNQLGTLSPFITALGHNGRANYYTPIAGKSYANSWLFQYVTGPALLCIDYLPPCGICTTFGYCHTCNPNGNDGVVRYVRMELNSISPPSTIPVNHIELISNPSTFNQIKSILGLETSSVIKEDTELPVGQPGIILVPNQMLAAILDTIYPNDEKSYNINISQAQQAEISLIGQGDNLSLNLTTPSGNLITKSTVANNIAYSEFNQIGKAYSINLPEPGVWKVDVKAINVPTSGENYSILTFLNTSLTLNAWAIKNQVKPNEPIEIKANLTNNSLPVIGANVMTYFTKPDKQVEKIPLYDDGLHNDSDANDGIYANIFKNSSLSGAHQIAISARGKLNDQPFERYQATTVWVQLYPDLTLSPSDISFSNPSPLPDQTVTLTATIHNIGEASANNASIFFYDGSPGTGNLIATNTIDVNAGETANVNTIWSALPGTHSINVWVSPFNAFLESNYSNNNASKLVSVDNPPVAPTPPSGPTSGVSGTSYSYSTSATDPDGDQVKYTFDWGDGTKNVTSLVSSGTSVSAFHKWSKAGIFLVKANAADSRGASSQWSTSLPVTIITPPNTPPSIPSIPSGSNSGYAYVPYSFSTSATDPNGDRVKYTFDWGDSTPRLTTDLVDSGTAVSAIHTWTSAGTYQIKAMTTDSKDAASGWSGSLAVTIAANKPPNAPTKLTGPTSGTVGTSYPYVTVATDPNGDKVKYTYDWGDGTTYTTPLVNSGSTASISHKWSTAGTYLVKTIAIDSKGAPSVGSKTLTVKIANKLRADSVNSDLSPTKKKIEEAHERIDKLRSAIRSLRD
jgi:hypothetical protein